MPGMKRAAFFDIDYTIISKNSMLLYVNYMRKRGEYTLWDVLVGLYYLAQYKLNIIDMESAMDQASLQYQGMQEESLREICDRWFEEQVRDYIYPEAEALVEYHRRAGDELCILSATSVYLTRPMSRHLKIEHYFCNVPEVKDGALTGFMRKPLCYGKSKLDYARKFVAEKGISLKDSFYYSDSITDLEAMAGFGFPVATNPDPLLRRQARSRGWKIIDFKLPPALKGKRGRKDAVTLKVF